METIVTVNMSFLTKGETVQDLMVIANMLSDENVIIVDNNGEELELELLNSSLTEVVSIDEDGEIADVIYSDLPQLSYTSVKSNVFDWEDMIHVADVGTFTLIELGNCVYLYDTSSRKTIQLEGSKLECLRLEILEKFPQYIVLKKQK